MLIVTSCRLDGQGVGLQFPAGARELSHLQIVEAGSGSHCASGALSLRIKWQGPGDNFAFLLQNPVVMDGWSST
jgi:hypothetical protein